MSSSEEFIEDTSSEKIRTVTLRHRDHSSTAQDKGVFCSVFILFELTFAGEQTGWFFSRNYTIDHAKQGGYRMLLVFCLVALLRVVILRQTYVDMV
jgi:hypothetical protein